MLFHFSKKRFLFLFILIAFKTSIAQTFYTGADLSYINSILDKGGEYRNDAGDIIDPYQYVAQRGAKMIRLRLWHTPENILDACGNPVTASNLNDVLLAAQRIHDNGMSLNLSLHYGDYFNDPAKQLRPNAWMGLTSKVLLDSIYQYTYKILEKLYEQNTTPYIVSIGNETTNGFIDETTPTNGFSWPEDADKFNAGLEAVDDFNTDYVQNILKAVHFTESAAYWVTGEFLNHSVTNFDVIGISYYPYFSPETSLDDVGHLFQDLIDEYNKKVILFETGFIWTHENSDSYSNFIANNGNKLDYPTSPQGQKDFLLDLSQVISDHGGMGVLYWESGWISSEMCDKWGQGSSYENACFFNFNEQNTPLPAFDFFRFEDTLSIADIHTPVQINVSPNPFNSKVAISYELEKPGTVTLIIYDQIGKPVINFSRYQLKGNQEMIWNACEFPDGVYYFRLNMSNKVATGKLLKVNKALVD
jgi:arabinogalactan endo-1,4-beta-galactosidase